MIVCGPTGIYCNKHCKMYQFRVNTLDFICNTFRGKKLYIRISRETTTKRAKTTRKRHKMTTKTKMTSERCKAATKRLKET